MASKLCHSLHVIYGYDKPLKIYYYNNSVVFYSNNNRRSMKWKFIDIRFFVVNERVQDRQIFTEHIRTNSTLVDPLTKGLIPKLFHEHNAHMGVISN